MPSSSASESSRSPRNPTSTSATYGKVQTIGNSTNIAWHNTTITRSHHNQQNQHQSTVLWFTGLSGSGKSTLANAVHSTLFARRIKSYILDGDNIRHGLCGDLGFSDSDRTENIRRIGHVAKLFVDAGMIVLTAFVSPFQSDRDNVRALLNLNNNSIDDVKESFIEVYCQASLHICETRDTKGLYQKARKGIIPDFTGISSPYEAPLSPELTIDTGTQPLEECLQQVIQYLEEKDIILPSSP